MCDVCALINDYLLCFIINPAVENVDCGPVLLLKC